MNKKGKKFVKGVQKPKGPANLRFQQSNHLLPNELSNIICFNSCQNLLLMGHEDGEISFWTVDGNGNHELSSIENRAHYGSVHTIFLWEEGDSSIFISSGGDKNIKFWNLLQQPVGSLVGDPKEAWIRSFCRIDQYLIGCCWNGFLHVFQMTDPLSCTRIYKTTKRAPQLSIVSVNNRVWSGDKDGEITIWDTQFDAPKDDCLLLQHQVLKAHDGGVSNLLRWKDKVVSASWDGRVIIWKVDHWRREKITAHEGSVYRLSIWDGYLVSCGFDEIVKIWKHDTTLYADFHQTGQFALTVMNNYSVIVSASKGKQFHIIKGPVPWSVIRLLWLAQMKNEPQDCVMARVPRDVIRVIISFVETTRKFIK